ncbi:Uncharacterised protein [Klebsiella variicola]|nr:Uncharacterised protein [Klebsiella variicola]SLW83446.1 Uncharacterised protein [Klebsiella variicola]SLY51180.1 Uncharacterised protein [Klebsiella variicola]SMA31897.1 Uncharacterised protein [Klebsiella variicola]SMA33025.1 Uncharacterised protein [Klebsiella variicola]
MVRNLKKRFKNIQAIGGLWTVDVYTTCWERVVVPM